MKDNRIEELDMAADTVKTEEQNAAATDLGKFRTVKALKDAYTALEAEFTRRSQRLKELEASNADGGPVKADNPPTPSQKAEETQLPAEYTAGNGLSDEVKSAIIEEYINSVRNNRSVPFVTGGGAVAAERHTPTTIREAGVLATKLFNNQEGK